MATYKELRQQVEELALEADEALRVARQTGIEQVLAIITEFGLTESELGLIAPAVSGRHVIIQKKSSVTPKSTRAPKYRDPLSGATWVGAGRVPKWIDGDRKNFLIKKDSL